MSKGFGGLPGNMQGLVKQAQKMQEQLKQAQEEAENISAEGSAGGGMVKVVANGKQRLVSIEIQKDVANPADVEMLQDLILAAANDALEQVQESVRTKYEKITGNSGLANFF